MSVAESKVRLVTLVDLTLHRIGSASAPWMAQCRSVQRIVEAADELPETLRALVIAIAEEQGERPGALNAMRQENAWHHTQQRNAVVFNIQGINTRYSTPYAICCAFPVLKIGDRYFKLEEIKC